MSSTTQQTTTDSIAKSLGKLRRQINLWFLVEGLSRFAACVLLMFLLDVYVDWQFNLDRAQRISMLVLVAIPILWVSYRYLFQPWLARLSDDALCLEVEKRNKQLGESLINAIQLSRATGTEIKHASSKMVNAAILQGVESANQIEFTKIVDRRRLRWNALLLAVCSLGIAGGAISVWVTSELQTWFKRNILLQDDNWANHQRFEFEGLENGELAVPHGSSWPFVVRMLDEVEPMPYSMEIDVRQSGGTRVESPERSERERQFKLTLKQLTAPFELRARSGRSHTDWHRVRTIHPPAVTTLELEITPPAYSGLSKKRLPAGEGPYYVLKGSQLAISGRADKPIAAATLLVGSVQDAMTMSGEDAFEKQLGPDKVTASTYRIELEDHERIWNPSTRTFAPLRSRDNLEFTLKNSPDLIPTVNASLEGVGGMVLPRARIPYRCAIEDDFGIRSTRMKLEWRSEAEDSKNETRTSDIAIAQTSPLEKKLSFQDSVDLSLLGLEPGSGFSFEIEAEDNDDVSGPKIGKSTKFLLRVVSENELRDNLLRREKELRQEFESVLKRQEDILTDTEAFRAGLPSNGELSLDQRKLLMECQHNEKLLAPNVVTIAARLSAIIVETQNNRIEESGGPIEQRLGKQIIEPMRKLGEETLPEIIRQLDVIRRKMDQVDARELALQETISAQRRAIVTMKEILGFMMKSEGFQEAVNLLYQVQQEQRSVSDLTGREKKERLERMLEKTNKSDSKKE